MTPASQSPEIVVAGAGAMGEEHVKALLAHGFDPPTILVVGRGRERAEALAARYGVRAAWGGVEALREAPPLGVVAVGEVELINAAFTLVERGATSLLVEKPGALNSRELGAFASAIDGRARAFVAYNRRFYPSVLRARELIQEDGGPLSTSFEFTEIESLVLAERARRGLSDEVLHRWGVANSLHVIDLAFHLAGGPVSLDARRAGSLPWHPSGSVFAGSGVTEAGALFGYSATWSGAGRWGVEIVTRERKLVLRPLESLWQQLRGSFALEEIPIHAGASEVKTGLSGQLAEFLAGACGGASPSLCSLLDARRRLEIAERMLGYS